MVIFYATVDFKIKLTNKHYQILQIWKHGLKLSYPTRAGPIQVVFLQNYKQNI